MAKTMERPTYILSAFILGWTKTWRDPFTTNDLFDNVNQDLFHALVMHHTEGRVQEHYNRSIARLFGEIVTKVKTFPTPSGWIILDKSTKRLLHKDIKNENEVDLLCKKHGYLR